MRTLTGNSMQRLMSQEMSRFEHEMSSLAPTPMERNLVACLRSIYKLTEKESGRWNRKTKAKVRAMIEGAV